MAVQGMGKKFSRKSSTYTIIWTIVGIFAAYTIFSFGKPYWIAYFFKKGVHSIANEDVLRYGFYDADLVADILDEADLNEVMCKDSDIDITQQGRRRQVDVRFAIPFQYFSFKGLWYFSTRCVGWRDVGKPDYQDE